MTRSLAIMVPVLAAHFAPLHPATGFLVVLVVCAILVAVRRLWCILRRAGAHMDVILTEELGPRRQRP